MEDPKPDIAVRVPLVPRSHGVLGTGPLNDPPTFPRSSSREDRIRVPLLSVFYFSTGTLPQERIKGQYWGT